MKISRTCIAICVSATLTACAGGGGSPVPEPPVGHLQTPLHAGQAPIVEIDGASHVGANVAAPRAALSLVARHGNADVSHGSVRDGVGAAELVAYLEADVASFASPGGEDGTDIQLLPEGLLFRFAAAPPTVRVAAGTPAELLDETVRVVQAINAALPPRLAPRVRPRTCTGRRDRTAGRRNFGHVRAAGGLASRGRGAGWRGHRTRGAAVRNRVHWRSAGAVRHRDRRGAGSGWTRRRPRGESDWASSPTSSYTCSDGATWMRVASRQRSWSRGGAVESSGHVLHPLDREALLAVYGRLDTGASTEPVAEALGPWSDTSMHVRGVLATEGGEIGFGAALRNGLSQPWASGSTPSASLEDNTELSGTARWTGRLLGLTPHAETVAGAVDLTVDVATLSGAAEFSALEFWPADAAPGAVGSGNVWRDGDLSYGIEVRGNRFTQTGATPER